MTYLQVLFPNPSPLLPMIVDTVALSLKSVCLSSWNAPSYIPGLQVYAKPQNTNTSSLISACLKFCMTEVKHAARSCQDELGLLYWNNYEGGKFVHADQFFVSTPCRLLKESTQSQYPIGIVFSVVTCLVWAENQISIGIGKISLHRDTLINGSRYWLLLRFIIKITTMTFSMPKSCQGFHKKVPDEALFSSLCTSPKIPHWAFNSKNHSEFCCEPSFLFHNNIFLFTKCIPEINV